LSIPEKESDFIHKKTKIMSNSTDTIFYGFEYSDSDSDVFSSIMYDSKADCMSEMKRVEQLGDRITRTYHSKIVTSLCTSSNVIGYVSLGEFMNLEEEEEAIWESECEHMQDVENGNHDDYLERAN